MPVSLRRGRMELAMPDRSMFALIALPILVLVATLFPSSSATSEPVTSPNPPKAEPARQGVRAAPLLSACDVVADYLGITTGGESSDGDSTVDVNARAGLRQLTMKLTEKKEGKRKDCASVVRSKLAGTIETAFIFIPDPTGSALALETDRALDAIRLAMSDQDFVPYKSNVLPWKSLRATDKEEKKPSGESPDEFVRPGVWLFRSKDTKESVNLKLLFLIGDSPTAGIGKMQFKSAVEQALSLTCKSEAECSNGGWANRVMPVHLVGPYFSGSIDSLAMTINRLCDGSTGVCPQWDIRATSGTAEVACLESSLSKAVGHHAKVSLKQITKHHSVERLVELLGDPSRTAILTESDTVFGLKSVARAETEGDTSGCTIKPGISKTSVFNYSRNLLNLRTAYEADRDLMSRIFPKSLRAEQLALHFGSTQTPSDALPTYAQENLAVSQQFQLRHLASKLRRERFANLVIVGSDNLDSVFLARFFQDENPNLRVAVTDSDVLLDRQAGAVSLRGVLSVSQSPTGSVSYRNHELPSGQALGIYRACRQQMFGWEDSANAVVSVVGFDGEWPLQILEPNVPPVNLNAVDFDLRPFHWSGPLMAFLTVVIWLAIAPTLYLWRGRIPYMLLRLMPFCRHANSPLYADDDRSASEDLRHSWCRVSLKFGWAILLVLSAIGVSISACCGSIVESRAMVARYFYFGAGVSPIPSLLALLLVLHACVWSRVRCCYLHSFTFRPMPSPLPYSGGGPLEECDDLAPLLRSVRLNATTFFSATWMMLYCFIAASVVMAYDLRVSTVELGLPAFFSRHIWTLLFACAGILIVNAAVRIGWLWISLRDLLRRLEYHPLRLGFTALPDRISWTSIWSPSGLRPTMISLQMCGDFLAAIDAESRATQPKSTALQGNIRAFMAKVNQGTFLTDPNVLTELAFIEAQMADITKQFRDDLMQSEYWAAQRIEGWNSAAPEAKKDHPPYRMPLHLSQDGRGQFSLDQAPEPPAKSLNAKKAQFIALQYAAFIRYAFMQLRNLLGFLMTASTLVFIALNIYPFSPMGSLTNFASFLFVLSTVVVVTMFYQMDCDPLLSRLSNTAAGKLDAGFGWRLAQFGALPAVTFLATHYPPIGQALVRFVQIIPGLAKL